MCEIHDPQIKMNAAPSDRVHTRSSRAAYIGIVVLANAFTFPKMTSLVSSLNDAQAADVAGAVADASLFYIVPVVMIETFVFGIVIH
jgi:hypothetical protein